VLHGLYWLTVNLADGRPLLIAVDDAHWADEPSLRWLAYLAPRLEGAAVALLVALRRVQPVLMGGSLQALLDQAQTVFRPELLSEGAFGSIVRGVLGSGVSSDVCAAVWTASGGNPLYLTELLRAARSGDRPLAELDPAELVAGGREGVARRVLAEVQGLHPGGLPFAQAVAVLGDGCALRHAAATAGVEVFDAISLAAALVRLEVLAADDPPRFVHPVVREAVEASLATDARDALHRSAAGLLHADRAPPGQVGASQRRAACRRCMGGGPWRTGVEALTTGELRVVRLAAEGRTNREIAYQLYVTLKTVEGHLSRAYAKLGIKGREELPRVLEPEKTRVPTP
jgi:DNA-binding NarL/FixJ family response regulator